jgi:hypothetical protein
MPVGPAGRLRRTCRQRHCGSWMTPSGPGRGRWWQGSWCERRSAARAHGGSLGLRSPGMGIAATRDTQCRFRFRGRQILAPAGRRALSRVTKPQLPDPNRETLARRVQPAGITLDRTHITWRLDHPVPASKPIAAERLRVRPGPSRETAGSSRISRSLSFTMPATRLAIRTLGGAHFDPVVPCWLRPAIAWLSSSLRLG